MSPGFVHWVLRTLDVEAARSFYEGVLEEGAPDATKLPELALARGAKPHWLGQLSVPDVAASTAAFVARRAVVLGNGYALRDPSGAILGLTSEVVPSRRDVLSEQLLTSDPATATKDYGELFGMTMRGHLDVPGHGVFETFAWGDGPVVGSVGDITGKPHIHPQWLFFFRVAELRSGTAYVAAKGGHVIGPTTLPDGRQVAVCDDPQGAAFALVETPRS